MLAAGRDDLSARPSIETCLLLNRTYLRTSINQCHLLCCAVACVHTCWPACRGLLDRLLTPQSPALAYSVLERVCEHSPYVWMYTSWLFTPR